MGAEALVAALAVARLGAVHVGSDPYDDAVDPLETHRPVVVLAEGLDVAAAAAVRAKGHHPRAVIWTGRVPEGQDLEWDVLMRAGRTDPAPPAEVRVTAEAFVVADSVLTVAEALEDVDAAWPVDAIGTLVAGGTVYLSLP